MAGIPVFLFPWVVIFISLLPSICSECTFPKRMIGTWVRVQDAATFVITANTVSGFSYHSSGHNYNNFLCEQIRGDRFLLVESKSSAYTGNVQFTYLCISIEVLGNNSILFTDLAAVSNSLTTGLSVDTPPLVFVKGLVDTTADLSTVDVCSSDVGDIQSDVLYRSGIGNTEGAIGVTCPDSILGNYNYTLDGTNCTGNSSLAVCGDRKSIVVDYNQCSDIVAYSNGGVLDCMGNVTREGATWLWAYNRDDTVDNITAFRTTCFVIEGSKKSVTLRSYPLNCPVGQNASNMSSLGHTLELVALDLCPFTASRDGSTQTIIIGTTVTVFILLAAIIMLIAVLCFRSIKRKQMLVSPKQASADINTKADDLTDSKASTVPVVVTDTQTAKHIETESLQIESANAETNSTSTSEDNIIIVQEKENVDSK